MENANEKLIDRIPIEKRGKIARANLSDNMRANLKGELARVKELQKLNDRMIAEKIGMSRATYSQMMCGKTMNLANIESIANALGCDVEIKFVPKDKKGEN